jgi:LPXTG-site transpeptidase (sortase) family protein
VPADAPSSRDRLSAGPAALVAVAVALVIGLVSHDAPAEKTPTSKPAAYAGEAIGRPDRVVVPSLDIAAPIVPIEVDPDGVLLPPADVDTVGWWQRSARPGSRSGQVLVTGHTVQDGDGAMDTIGRLEPDDRVRIHSGRRAAVYRVTGVEVLSRAQVADRAQRLFGQQRGGGRLVLVTCTDWNGESYESNVVVFAEPVRTT